MSPERIVLFIVFLLFAGTVHELCHALAADHFGDPTPRMQNRLTLNPIPHIDPVWTILMPIVLLIASGGTMAFGGAKPVSMNPTRFRHPERDFTIAAVVGPLSNFVMAGIALLVGLAARRFLFPDVRFRSYSAMYDWMTGEIIMDAIFVFYLVNIILGLFNMIPIPPLDGSRLLRFFLPPDLKQKYDQLSGPLGMVLILVFFATGLFGLILSPFMNQSLLLFLQIISL